MRENSAEEETFQAPYFSSRKENMLLQFTQTFPSTQEFSNLTRLGAAKLSLILSDFFLIFFSPLQQNKQSPKKKAETLWLVVRKGNFMIKTPWKIVVSRTDHCFSGGSKNFLIFLWEQHPSYHITFPDFHSPHISPGVSAQQSYRNLNKFFWQTSSGQAKKSLPEYYSWF